MESNVTSQKTDQKISASQWMRLLIVYAFIPFLLFVCAGDFAWWQAWVFFLLFATAGIGGRLLAERQHPGLTSERQSAEHMQEAKSWDKVLAPLMAVSLCLPLVIVAGLDHRFGWSPEFPLWLVLIGIFLTAFGYAFGVWAFMENRYFSSVVRIQSDRGHAVCDTGPYRFVRHPGYAGNLLPLIGIVFLLSSYWTIIPAVAALVIAFVRTSLEDRALQEELPGYKEYAQRVRYRLIPGVY